MLQQTRVDAVVPYYNAWLESFPTIDALANADEHAVLKKWEGLGYYSRARNLHAAAKVVREAHNGAVPSSYEQLRALPGVGDYTAGAILSIAHRVPAPAVDGNVRRVLSRLFDVDAEPAELRALAARLVDVEQPGDFNQSVMELGATVCTPRSPSCFACPVAHHCDARKNGTIELRPRKKAKKQIPTARVLTLVTLHNGRVVLRRRPRSGLFAGLWEFPESSRLPNDAVEIGQFDHRLTHRRIVHDVWLSHRKKKLHADQAWVPLEDLADYALPKAQRSIADALSRPITATSRRPSSG